jgi:hypothetical protein
VSESQNSGPSQGGSGQGGGNNRRRRRPQRSGGQSTGQGPNPNQGQNRQGGHSEGGQQGPRQDNRPQQSQSQSRGRRPGGRVLTSNQILVKYDNLLEQHLITRRKYFEYFNRVDYRQLKKLEYSFYDSVEHLRRFEFSLEPWQREVLEKRKTERYKLDLTYSNNRGWNPEEIAKADFAPDENEDPHFKDTQKEAYQEYRDDVEESSGTYEDYLKLKGLV